MSLDDTNPLPGLPVGAPDRAWREGLPPAAYNHNQLAVALISAKGWTTQQLAEAGGDIQRAAALANGGGKIVLPGRAVN